MSDVLDPNIVPTTWDNGTTTWDDPSVINPNSVNTSYSFFPGWVPNSDDWNRMMTGKVDATNGYAANPTIFGNMYLVESPSAPLHATNKAYVDAVLGDSNSLPDAPADGTPYCRMNNGWSPAPTTLPSQVVNSMSVTSVLSVGGIVVIPEGPVLIGTTAQSGYMLDIVGTARIDRDPVNPNDLATKHYVDQGDGATLSLTIDWQHPVTVSALNPIPSGLFVCIMNYGGSPFSRPSDNNAVFVIASDGTFTANTDGIYYPVILA